jgi:hypothetical protein
MENPPMNKREGQDQYSDQETRKRFEAALRGARFAGPRHKESVTPKRASPQRKKTKKNVAK